MPSRRRLLAAAGLATATATAGCMSALGSDDPDSGNDVAPGSGEGTPEGVRLEQLSIENNHDSGHEVQLAIENAAGVVHMDTYSIDSGGGTVVEGDWNSTPGEYVLYARLDDAEITSTDVSASLDDETGCVRMVLRIDADGELDLLFGTNCDT